MVKLSSNARLFEKRGDIWVSPKEQLNCFGRILETENPDFDQFARARKAEPKPKYVDPPGQERPVEGDFLRRKANILLKLHADMRRHDGHIVKVQSRATVFRPCPGCRKAICIRKGICDKPK